MALRISDTTKALLPYVALFALATGGLNIYSQGLTKNTAFLTLSMMLFVPAHYLAQDNIPRNMSFAQMLVAAGVYVAAPAALYYGLDAVLGDSSVGENPVIKPMVNG